MLPWFTELHALQAINEALEKDDSSLTVQKLQNPVADLPSIDVYASKLYHAELSGMKQEKQGDLDYEELSTAVKGMQEIGDNIPPSCHLTLISLRYSVEFSCSHQSNH